MASYVTVRHERLWGPAGELSLKAASQHIIHQVSYSFVFTVTAKGIFTV